MKKVIAVIISDVHYNLNTLEVADKAMRMAIAKANELDVHLVVSGDLHDSKANLRAECVNTMLSTFEKSIKTPIIVRGNHDQLHEKSTEHSLNFLFNDAIIIEKSMSLPMMPRLHFIPYQHDANTFRELLKAISKDRIILAHQGITNSSAGHYIQDKSAIRPEDVAGRRIISGHYHTRQTIKLPDGGQWDYVGNPFTLGFGEANDPQKGFQILYNDGSLEFVPTNLRKHVIHECTTDFMALNLAACPPAWVEKGDLLWVKVTGPKEKLTSMSKKEIANHCGFFVGSDFKLDLIPLDTITEAPKAKDQTQGEILDSLIDSLTNTSPERKERVKQLWKDWYENL